ncbi:MAG: hypothetical protein ACRBBP_00105 [Bdellovibrionales bacterium]
MSKCLKLTFGLLATFLIYNTLLKTKSVVRETASISNEDAADKNPSLESLLSKNKVSQKKYAALKKALKPVEKEFVFKDNPETEAETQLESSIISMADLSDDLVDPNDEIRRTVELSRDDEDFIYDLIDTEDL